MIDLLFLFFIGHYDLCKAAANIARGNQHPWQETLEPNRLTETRCLGTEPFEPELVARQYQGQHTSREEASGSELMAEFRQTWLPATNGQRVDHRGSHPHIRSHKLLQGSHPQNSVVRATPSWPCSKTLNSTVIDVERCKNTTR